MAKCKKCHESKSDYYCTNCGLYFWDNLVVGLPISFIIISLLIFLKPHGFWKTILIALQAIPVAIISTYIISLKRAMLIRIKGKGKLISKLTSGTRGSEQNKLLEQALNHDDPSVRRTALEKINNQKKLEQIVKTNKNEDIRKLAVKKIKSAKVLDWIIRNDKTKSIQEIASLRLLELLPNTYKYESEEVRKYYKNFSRRAERLSEYARMILWINKAENLSK